MSVSVLTSLNVAVEREIVTGKRFFYIMRSDHKLLSAGEVVRKLAKYQHIRAHRPATQG
jgi:hypothetical protein